MRFTPEQESMLLQMARDVIRGRLENPQALPPDVDAPLDSPDPVLSAPAGCFVSLHNRSTHALRGCIGRIEAVDPLIVALRQAAASVLDDPRFQDQPVTMDELPELELELSILGELKLAASPLDFDPLVQGIFLTIDGRRGCFLPQVARETGWTREQLLNRLCAEKLGLSPHAWKAPDAQLQTFATAVIGPRPFLE